MAVAAVALAPYGNATLLDRFRSCVPKLTVDGYKGQQGKVAVVGGCLEFTGAPFFASMSALKVGADMAYVVCTPSAKDAIKSYSPELMVLPYLPDDTVAAVDYRNGGPLSGYQPQDEQGGQQGEGAGQPLTQPDGPAERILPWLKRASAVVVGPGLGDHPHVCRTARALMLQARALGLPLLVDGSALTHIVARDPSVVAGNRACVLTPNVAELGRIAAALHIQLPGAMGTHWQQHVQQITDALNGPVLLSKGPSDLICWPGGAAPVAQSDQAALRRCGGQGDVLAGTAAAFMCWAALHHKQQQRQQGPGAPIGAGTADGAATSSGGTARDVSLTDSLVVATYAACTVMRHASAAAFAAHERSMLAGDIIPHLHPALKDVIERR